MNEQKRSVRSTRLVVVAAALVIAGVSAPASAEDVPPADTTTQAPATEEGGAQDSGEPRPPEHDVPPADTAAEAPANEEERTRHLGDPRHPEHIEEIVVTAPLPRAINQLAVPVVVMTEAEIRERAAPQIGEILGDLPGISQSFFGLAASRPVIRGLAGDNIRVLENGLGLLDASSISPDHAVSIEPLLLERAEVIRGPSALLYGPNAIGGVVNVMTRRLPDEPIDELVTGATLGRGNSVNNEGAGVVYFEGGYRGFAIHADGFGRETDNYSIPGFARSSDLRKQAPPPPGETEEKGEVINSWLENAGGAVGAAYHWDGGYFGVSPEIYYSKYGIPGAPSSFIDLEQRRLDIGGSLDAPLPRITSITSRLGLVHYEHQELEATTRGDRVATTFENRGYNARIDVVQEPVNGFEGAFGFESFYSDFDASGAEAFFPRSTTVRQSLFAFEELVWGPARLQAAGRLDISSVDSEDSPIFGPGDSRDFVTGGGSLGAVVTPLEPYSMAVNVAYVMRPPNAAELYAFGPHLATGQFEVGDPNLRPQKSLGFEVVARKEAGLVTGSLAAYYNHIDDYIDLIPTGEFFDTAELGHSHGGDPIIPVFEFRNVPAMFVGTESELTVHAVEAATYDVHVNFQADYVFARDRDTKEALPYLPPLRLSGEVVLHWKELSARASLLWANRQDNTPEFIFPTDGYVMLNIGATYYIPTSFGAFNLYLRGTNLLNQEARLSTSTRKEFAPLPGAGVSGGALFRF